MKNFKSLYVQAKDLMQDDHFKIAGLLYRITKITTNDFDEKVVRAFPIEGNTQHGNLLIVPKHMVFKIYNQSK